MNCASRMKCVTKSGSFCRFACKNFIATKRRNCVSRAFQTSPIPPCPSRSISSYFPSRSSSLLIPCPQIYFCHPEHSEGSLRSSSLLFPCPQIYFCHPERSEGSLRSSSLLFPCPQIYFCHPELCE